MISAQQILPYITRTILGEAPCDFSASNSTVYRSFDNWRGALRFQRNKFYRTSLVQYLERRPVISAQQILPYIARTILGEAPCDFSASNSTVYRSYDNWRGALRFQRNKFYRTSLVQYLEGRPAISAQQILPYIARTILGEAPCDFSATNSTVHRSYNTWRGALRFQRNKFYRTSLVQYLERRPDISVHQILPYIARTILGGALCDFSASNSTVHRSNDTWRGTLRFQCIRFYRTSLVRYFEGRRAISVH